MECPQCGSPLDPGAPECPQCKSAGNSASPDQQAQQSSKLSPGVMQTMARFDRPAQAASGKTQDNWPGPKFGWLMLIWGAVLCAVGIIMPLEEASRHASYVSTWIIATGLGPFCTVGGLGYLIFGEKMGAPRKLTPLGNVVFVIGLLIGVAAYFLLKMKLQALGYRF